MSLGEYGARLLVTVLFSRTQPLIRYELSDRVAASPDSCPDGLPFGLLKGVEGRAEDLLSMTALDGGRAVVHPNVFHAVLEDLPMGGWQVVQEPDRLHVLLVDAPPSVSDADVVRAIVSALYKVGASPPDIVVERVAAIPRTALGKAPLVVRQRGDA